MCGICGMLSFSGAANAQTVEKMKAAMFHRGPDANGTLVQQPIVLGHQRLSIIDLSDNGSQPMQLEHLSLVFNGCIYNYKSLREELISYGAVFQSNSDTEVILHAWQRWGKKALERLDGMFAFAIWDDRQQQLYLVRDRFGIKPLYVAHDKQRIQFSSTLPSLMAGDRVSGELDSEALGFLFSLHAVVPAPRTVFKGVRKLEPAHVMSIDVDGKAVTERYWSLSLAQRGDDTQWQADIEHSLREAVKKRLLSADVPVGVLLSGGLDSSLIVALIEDIRQDMLKSEGDAPDLLTFSIGFDDIEDEVGSEFYYSDHVVRQFKTKHHRFHIGNDAVLKALPNAIANMSEPMFGQDAVAFYLLSEQVAQHVKVVLSGQGADEVFGGYFWYPQMQQHDHAYPHDSSADKFSPYYLDRSWSEMQRMLNPEWIGDNPLPAWLNQRLDEDPTSAFSDRILKLDSTTLIVDDPVKRVDNMTMAFSLEARVPFLDTNVVETAAKSPAHWRLQKGGKYPLKQLGEKYFDKNFIYRQKGYFPMPALKHIKGEFKDWMADILHSSVCKQRGLYQSKYVETLLSNPEEPEHYTRLQGSKLWHMALLEAWLQTHL